MNTLSMQIVLGFWWRSYHRTQPIFQSSAWLRALYLRHPLLILFSCSHCLPAVLTVSSRHRAGWPADTSLWSRLPLLSHYQSECSTWWYYFLSIRVRIFDLQWITVGASYYDIEVSLIASFLDSEYFRRSIKNYSWDKYNRKSIEFVWK